MIDFEPKNIYEYKIEEDSITNAPFPKDYVELYDVNASKIEVKKKVDKYRISQIEVKEITPPKVTPDYEVRFEQFNPNKIDTVGTYNQNKLDNIILINDLYLDFVLAFKRLNRSEFTYIMDCLFYDKSEHSVIEKLDITKYSFKDIKDSCIIKVAKALNVAVYKK